MGRVGKKLSLEDKAIAAENSIPLATVYARLKRGWDKQTALTKTPSKSPASNLEREEGLFTTSEPKGKNRSFLLPQKYDQELDKLISESGKTASDWVAQVVIDRIKASRKKAK
ncbi:MAG: hypothetical protein F6K24_39490 [Okeania sp. SIO2D1]|nr:hypothetical protein [Okeania sp. SIO2D1]